MKGIKQIAVGRSDVFRVAPEDIHIREGWNARDFSDPENAAHVELLAASIAEIGVKNPLRVYAEDGKLYLTDGESRLRAVRLAIERGAEIVSVPVITEDRYSNDADRLLTQIVGNSGKPFAALEKADVFYRLIGLGWTPADIARKAGVSKQHVTDMLALRSAPSAVTDAVKAGDVSPTLAMQTVKKHGREAAGDVLASAVKSAKDRGKTRATPRDVGATATQETLRAMVARSLGNGPQAGFVQVYFSPSDIERLRQWR